LAGGVEAVNLCTLDGVADELLSYAGSGTLFTRGGHLRGGPLGPDLFAPAERPPARGPRGGLPTVPGGPRRPAGRRPAGRARVGGGRGWRGSWSSRTRTRAARRSSASTPSRGSRGKGSASGSCAS